MTTPAEHRRDLAELERIARRDLELLFARADSPAEIQAALMDTTPRLVAIYGSAAATLAADWYDEQRERTEARGRFRAIPAAYVADDGRTESLARWAVSPMYRDEPNGAAKVVVLAKAWGGVQRLIADADRETVIGSARRDPSAGGWSRHTNGKTCGFCERIAGRGAIYSADTADFSSHDGCDCVAVPAFGAVREVKAFTPSQRFRSDAARSRHNARTRAWLAE